MVRNSIKFARAEIIEINSGKMNKNQDIHKLVQNTYNKIARKYYTRYGQQSNFFLKYSNEFLKLLPKQAKILDLGCGPGRDTKFFSEKGYQVVGIDFSESMIEIARKAAPKAKFIQKDFRKLNFEQNSFDGIWCSLILLHLKRNEVLKFLKSIKRFLKKDGVLFLATKKGEGEIIEKEHLDKEMLMFETFFQQDELEKLVKKPGYRIINSQLDTDRYESDEKLIVIFAQK